MQQAAFAEFFEDVHDALKEAVRQLGGHKKVGPKLWPELPLEQAGNRLRDCLNADRRDKLDPNQVLFVLSLAREAGFHGAMAWLATAAGYEAPRPVVPEEREAELMRVFIDTVDRLDSIKKELTRVRSPRSVA